jgi:signal transduction histidine kinase
VVSILRDLTEQKREEAQRHQGQKMESIGQLAAGVAHEINTPIQFIGDNLRFLGDSFGDLTNVLDTHNKLLEAARADGVLKEAIAVTDAASKRADVAYLTEEIPKAIAQSLEGVTRVAEIVRAMKEFSHPDQGEKKPTDLNKAITTTLIVARNEYKYVADLVTEFDPELPAVPCIVGEFNQVVLNLIVNAAHAIGDVIATTGGKGVLTISTKVDGDYVEVRIRDSGTGIPESARAKIFDPFFTTKAVGKGTGQGLYIAHTVVAKKHGGTLTFETEIGKGTTFIIRLPMSP